MQQRTHHLTSDSLHCIAGAGGPRWLLAVMLCSLREDSVPAHRLLLSSAKVKAAVMDGLRKFPDICRADPDTVSIT
jgi:hypothetical protein